MENKENVVKKDFGNFVVVHECWSFYDYHIFILNKKTGKVEEFSFKLNQNEK